jgi:hypothetical protein
MFGSMAIIAGTGMRTLGKGAVGNSRLAPTRYGLLRDITTAAMDMSLSKAGGGSSDAASARYALGRRPIWFAACSTRSRS